MKFTLNGVEYDTKDYISSFVDENTGDVIESRKVLDRQVRLLWFRSEYPDAVFKRSVITSNNLDVLKNISNLTEEQIHELTELAKNGNNAAIAETQIFNGDKLIAQNYAMRFEDIQSKFTYYIEAAVNASTDRAISDLGFICPEEICKAPVREKTLPDDEATPTIVGNINGAQGEPKQPETKPFDAEGTTSSKSVDTPRSNNPKALEAISNIAQLVDEETTDVSEPKGTEEQNVPCYDSSTPVEEILKIMTTADARSYVIKCGKMSGKTVGEVYEDDKDKNGFSNKLDFFATKYKGNDNILRAACIIVNRK